MQTTVLRTGFSGELGFELVTDPGSAPALWDALIAAGGKPFGLEAIDIARVTLPYLPDGMDLGGLYDLAEELCESGF